MYEKTGETGDLPSGRDLRRAEFALLGREAIELIDKVCPTAESRRMIIFVTMRAKQVFRLRLARQ
jgi:hypothetical protein